MLKNRRLRCIDIGINIVIFIKCADINMRFQTLKNEFVEIKIQIHIILNLKCDIILKVFIFKFNNIILFWFLNLLHFDNHTISITIFSKTISKTKNEFLFSLIWTTKFNIVLLIQCCIKKNVRYFSIYVNKIVILKFNESRNVLIRHRFLFIKKNYLFKFIL